MIKRILGMLCLALVLAGMAAADGVPLPPPTDPRPLPQCPWYNPICSGGGGGW